MRARLVCAVVGMCALGSLAGGGAGEASVPSCRSAERPAHDEAVFGHFSTREAAVAFQRKVAASGFRGTEIENDGCGDYELELEGLDTAALRRSFAAEAEGANFTVSFEQTAPPLRPARGQVVGVLGEFGRLAAADRFARAIARRGFIYVDIAYSSGRWLVVWPELPIRAERSVAAEVKKAHLHISFRH